MGSTDTKAGHRIAMMIQGGCGNDVAALPSAGLSERILKMTGDVDQLMRAVALVVTKLSENPDYHLLTVRIHP